MANDTENGFGPDDRQNQAHLEAVGPPFEAHFCPLQSRVSFANKVLQGEVFWRADRHIRRGGRGGEWSGDACVARWGRGKALMGPGRGRRKRPHPPHPPPPPLRGRRRFPSVMIKNLPLKAGAGWMWGGDACVAPAGGGRLMGPGRGRRKRPHPTPHPPPPLRENGGPSSLT